MIGTVMRGLRFELRTKLRRAPLAGLLMVALSLIPLAVWRNVSYVTESVEAGIPMIETEIAREISEMPPEGTEEAIAAQDRIDRMERQLLADRYDLEMSSAPGGGYVALGLGASVGAVALALLLGGVLVGSEYSRGRGFYWYAMAKDRRDMIVAKTLAAPVISTVVTLVITLVGFISGMLFNQKYRGDWLWGWSELDTTRLATCFGSTVLVITFWTLLVLGIAFVTRSGMVTAVVVLSWIGVDAAISNWVSGLAPFFLTMRFAQLGVPLWPPYTPNSIDTAGYHWWIGEWPNRFPETFLPGVLLVSAWVAVGLLIGLRRIRGHDLEWS